MKTKTLKNKSIKELSIGDNVYVIHTVSQMGLIMIYSVEKFKITDIQENICTRILNCCGERTIILNISKDDIDSCLARTLGDIHIVCSSDKTLLDLLIKNKKEIINNYDNMISEIESI